MSNELKVGITVLLAILVAIVGFRFMRDVPILRQSQEITASFDRVDGISQGSVVYIRGVKVGSVSSVALTQAGAVQLSMRIDPRTDIPRGSVARLTSTGIVEGKSIVIQLGDSSEMVESGEEIEGVYVEDMLEALSHRGEELGDDVSQAITELNRFLRQLNETLDDDTRTTLDETLKSAAEATHQIASILEGKQQEIDRAIDAGSSMLSQLDTLATESRPRIDSLMLTIENNLDEMEKVRLEMEAATANLNQILDKVNQGEGTLGKFVNDPSMYENVDSLIVELNNLIKGINENPGRYLRHMSIIDIF